MGRYRCSYRSILDRSIYCIICTNRLLAGHAPLGHTDALAGSAREREREGYLDMGRYKYSYRWIFQIGVYTASYVQIGSWLDMLRSATQMLSQVVLERERERDIWIWVDIDIAIDGYFR